MTLLRALLLTLPLLAVAQCAEGSPPPEPPVPLKDTGFSLGGEPLLFGSKLKDVQKRLAVKRPAEASGENVTDGGPTPEERKRGERFLLRAVEEELSLVFNWDSELLSVHCERQSYARALPPAAAAHPLEWSPGKPSGFILGGQPVLLGTPLKQVKALLNNTYPAQLLKLPREELQDVKPKEERRVRPRFVIEATAERMLFLFNAEDELLSVVAVEPPKDKAAVPESARAPQAEKAPAKTKSAPGLRDPSGD